MRQPRRNGAWMGAEVSEREGVAFFSHGWGCMARRLHVPISRRGAVGVMRA